MNKKVISSKNILNKDTGKELYQEYVQISQKGFSEIDVDLSATEKVDSFGGAYLIRIINEASSNNITLQIVGEKNEVKDFLNLISKAFTIKLEKPEIHFNLFYVIGTKAFKFFSEIKEALILFISILYWSILAPFEGKGLKWNTIINEISEMGVNAIGIILLLNFIIGAILALLSGAQLKQFFAERYAADLIAIAFTREMGPLITAIIISARSGSAIAAELSTMVVQEEIDAIRGIGLDVTRFLITPKVIGILITMPCLVFLSMLAGISGGMLVGLFSLDLSIDVWMTETINVLSLRDILEGIFKSLWFALIIVLIGCHNGLRVSAGARGVGLMTTRSVVMDIFTIIVVDMIFALIFYIL